MQLVNTFLLLFLIGFAGFLGEYLRSGNAFTALCWPVFLIKKITEDYRTYIKDNTK